MTILLLTGPIGSGKSTVAARLVALATARGLRCDGLLCHAHVDEEGRKVGIDGLRLGTGERRHLADRDLSRPGVRFGTWRFEPGAMEWSLQVVMDAIGARPDLLVVDEIGPMELLEGRGLAPVIPELRAGKARLTIMLVRVGFLPDLLAQLAGCALKVYEVTPESRDALPEQIAAEWL